MLSRTGPVLFGLRLIGESNSQAGSILTVDGYHGCSSQGRNWVAIRSLISAWRQTSRPSESRIEGSVRLDSSCLARMKIAGSPAVSIVSLMNSCRDFNSMALYTRRITLWSSGSRRLILLMWFKSDRMRCKSGFQKRHLPTLLLDLGSASTPLLSLDHISSSPPESTCSSISSQLEAGMFLQDGHRLTISIGSFTSSLGIMATCSRPAFPSYETLVADFPINKSMALILRNVHPTGGCTRKPFRSQNWDNHKP